MHFTKVVLISSWRLLLEVALSGCYATAPPLTAGLAEPSTAGVMENVTRWPSLKRDSTCLEDTLIYRGVNNTSQFIFLVYILHFITDHNKILERDWFLARSIFHQIGAWAAKCPITKFACRAIGFLFVTEYHALYPPKWLFSSNFVIEMINY